MGHSSIDPAFQELRPWNEGRLLGAKRALKPQQVWAIRFWLDQHQRLRDRALFDFAIDSKLRGCDVVKVCIGDIVSGGRIRDRAGVVQQKTKRPVQFEIVEPARRTLFAWLERRGGTLIADKQRRAQMIARLHHAAAGHHFCKDFRRGATVKVCRLEQRLLDRVVGIHDDAVVQVRQAVHRNGSLDQFTATNTMSLAAASSLVPAVIAGPSAATIAARLSGPRLLASAARWPARARMVAIA